MRWAGLVALLFVVSSLAGCSGDAPDAGSFLEIGVVQTGKWTISATKEYLLVWVHNLGSEKTSVSWRFLDDKMGPLPSGWNATFSPASAELEPRGTKHQNPRGGTSYPDWAWTLVTLQVPSNATARDYSLTLDASGHHQSVVAAVANNRTKVSAPGDSVTVHYKGSFEDTGSSFDSGDFPTRLGSGQTVPGFDYGLIGLALNEKARLRIPPAMGYGYDNTDPSYAKFNGKTLLFDVEITKFG